MAESEEETKPIADPTAAHHLPDLSKQATDKGEAQTKVLAAGMLEEGEGERVLTVNPDGTHSVDFVPKGETNDSGT